MAQWSRADRTLYAKLVYYGPAYGGKTTNLHALHRLTDPQSKNKLLSVKTANDRTLFFDLLPFDLGDILGYQVAMKLYTVPGQVRYDTTRQVVLAGSDAVVFVADSTKTRRDQNVWSLQNLHMNMRAKRLDPKRVPVLYQFNKRDLPEAAPTAEVASWLKVPESQGFPAVAVRGEGVLETFRAACRAMLERLVMHAGERTRQSIDRDELAAQVDRAFEPLMARASRVDADVAEPAPQAQQGIVLQGDDLLERSVRSSVHLGEKLANETARAARLEREAEAFRQLGESLRTVGASFDRERIVDATLEVVATILEAPVVSLLGRAADGSPSVERVAGATDDPLIEAIDATDLAARILRRAAPCVVDDLRGELGGAPPAPLAGFRAIVAVPVEVERGRTLVAYAPDPDGRFGEQDVRFVSTAAGHLAAGLEKARLHETLECHRDELERAVAARTEALRRAYDDLRQLDRMKDRFLTNLSHEMKTPLTAVLTSAMMMRDYEPSPAERREMAETIVAGAESIRGRLDDLFRLVSLEQEADGCDATPLTVDALLDEARQLAGRATLPVDARPLPRTPCADRPRLARAVANLIDNAFKYVIGAPRVELRVGPGELEPGLDGWRIDVLDRGPGIPEADRERVFLPFEQGGELLTGKPSGIGLGLHEARTIVERHGGRLVHRPREGGGSVFSVLLPYEVPATREVVEAAGV